MAAARDQAARIVRSEPDPAEGESARDAGADLAESLRAHLADETVARRPAETPDGPAVEKAAAVAPSAVQKSGNRKKAVLTGIAVVLALAAAAYGVHYVLIGRFFISTDDAY